MGTSPYFLVCGRAHGKIVLIASPYLPFPLSHGGAVRMFNLMRLAANDHDLILVAFVDELAAPPEELLALCAQIVLVQDTVLTIGVKPHGPIWWRNSIRKPSPPA